MDEGGEERGVGSRDLYLNFCDALDSAWHIQELDKY